MKKNIIIFVLAMTSIVSTVYAFYQRTEAGRQKILADTNAMKAFEMEKLAHAQMDMAEKNRRMAEVSAIEAMKRVAISEELLKKCKKSR